MHRLITLTIYLVLGLLTRLACAGQAIPLTVTPGEKSLVVSTQLHQTYWKDGNGTADVNLEEIGTGRSIHRNLQVQYAIKKLILSARIPYLRRDTQQVTIKIRLSGIRDKNDDASAVFEGESTLPGKPNPPAPQRLPADTKTDSVVAAQVVVNPEKENTAPGNNPPASLPTPPGGGPQSISGNEANSASPPPNPWHDWWAYGNTVGLAGCITWMIWKRKAFQARVDLSPKIKQLENRINTEVAGVTDKLTELQLRAEKRPPPEPTASARLEAVLGPIDDLERLARIARGATAESIPKPGVTGRSEQGLDYKVAAAVNRWLVDGARDHRKLLKTAEACGLKAKLASLRDSSRKWDPTSFEYSFETNDDGAWLWTSIPGTNDVWVCPAAAAMLGMGAVPSILACLFEGMEHASQGFRFQCIYRPCRLRPSGRRADCYVLAGRGLLQLVGDPPPAGAVLPTISNTEMQTSSLPAADASTMSQQTLVDGGRNTVGKSLADWLEAVSQKLKSQAAEFDRLKEAQQEQLRKLLAQEALPVPANSLEVLEARIGLAMSNTQNVVLELHHMKTRLETLDAGLNEVRTTHQRPNNPAGPLEASSVTEESKGLASAETTTVGNGDVSSRASQNGEAGGPVSEAQVKHENWEQPWHAAAQEPDSRPDVGDIPNQDLYVQRVLNLERALRTYAPESPVSVVHLKKDGLTETFEIHPIQETNTSDVDSGLLCPVCKVFQSWQIAVCVGEQGGPHLRILYPQGRYGQSNFSSGYSALLDNPSASFILAELGCPAELRLKNRQAAIYEVKRKMMWNQACKLGRGQS